MKVLITAVVFLLSGMAGLIYEVVWFRMLATSFGATGPAMAATTGAFMAGLGLGSCFAGRFADRVRSPVAVYAMLELLIAGIAVALPGVLHRTELLLDAAVAPTDSNTWRLAAQFSAIVLILLIPTCCMGATLPMLVRVVITEDGHIGRRFAILYGSNTLGAAIGTILTGFLLIPTFGISGSVRIAVALNVLAGLGALILIRRGPPGISLATLERPVDQRGLDPVDIEPSGFRSVGKVEPPVSPDTVLFVAMITGLVSLGSQYLWARSLIFHFDRLKNTTYSFSAVLAVSLVGLVIGIALAAMIIDRIRCRRMLLAGLTSLLGLSIMLSAVQLLTLPKLADSVHPVTLEVNFPRAVAGVCLRTAMILGVPSILMGLLLPACVRTIAMTREVAKDSARVYAWNTIGAVIGAFAAAFLVTPLLGLLKGLVFLGFVELVLVIGLLQKPRLPRLICPVLIIVAAVVIRFLPGTWSLQSLLPGERVIRSVDGTIATVSVVENDRGERRISVDDVPVAGTSLIMQTDQKSLAHWGMLLADDPRRALTVGFGSGGASWSFLLHDRLEKLDCVEICPDVPTFADLLTDANHGLLEPGHGDARYRIIYADARAFLRTVSKPYDVIVSDCTDLRYRSSANLYDLEYFQLCRNAMTNGGCTLIWMPLGGLSEEAFLMTLRTFAEVFPEMQIYYLHNRWTHYVLLAGHRRPFQLQADQLRAVVGEADVLEDLRVIGMTDPLKIAATLCSSAKSLSTLLEGASLNTEDMPLLEFLVPRFDSGPWSAQRNLNLLRRRRASIDSILQGDLTDAERKDFHRFSEAAAHIMEAQEADRATDVERATLAYLAAFALTPEDPSLGESLDFPALRIAGESGNPTAWLLLGRSYQLQQRFREADESVNLFFELSDSLKRSPAATTEELKRLEQAEAWHPTATLWQSAIRGELHRRSAGTR